MHLGSPWQLWLVMPASIKNTFLIRPQVNSSPIHCITYVKEVLFISTTHISKFKIQVREKNDCFLLTIYMLHDKPWETIPALKNKSTFVVVPPELTVTFC